MIAYAIVDETVTYENRKTLYVNGELLGAVPQLAICQNLGESEVLVFHCDETWEVLGAVSYASVLIAVQKVERSYTGLLQKWVQIAF